LRKPLTNSNISLRHTVNKLKLKNFLCIAIQGNCLIGSDEVNFLRSLGAKSQRQVFKSANKRTFGALGLAS
jgi:hypothetical protein